MRCSRHALPSCRSSCRRPALAQTSKDRAGGFGSSARARSRSRSMPTSLDVFDKESRAVFAGNVVAVQGDSTMKCTTMTVLYEQRSERRRRPAPRRPARAADDSAIKKIDCKGPVTIVSKTQVATGDNATFDRVANKILLIGNVTLSDGPNVTRGERIVYDLNTGVANVETDPGGRVRALFVPGSERAPRPPPAAAAKAAEAEAGQKPATNYRRMSASLRTPSVQRCPVETSLSAALPQSVPDRRPPEADPVPRRTPPVEAAPTASGRFGGARHPRRQGPAEELWRPHRRARRGADTCAPARRSGLLGPNGAGKTTIFYMITGLVAADRGIDQPRRPRHHPPADVPPRPPRHRLSAAGGLDLPRPQRRGQHPRRARGRRAEPARSASASSMRCSRSSTSRACASRPPSRSRAASGGAARSPARSPASRPSCCSTSPSPASTRSRSATSRTWSGT